REAMQRGKLENANFFAAIAFLVAQARIGNADALEKGLHICGALGWYWHIVGLHLAAQGSVDELLAMAQDLPPSRGRGKACFTSGMISANTGALDVASRTWALMASDGLAIGDDEIAGFGPGGTGYAMLGLGQFAEAGPFLDEAVTTSARSGNEFLFAMMMTIQGMQQFLVGDLERGLATVERARAIQVRIGDGEGGGMALSFLAQMQFAKGDISRAMELYRQSEVDFTTVGDKPELARVQGE